jgi:DNA-binding transcriptional LysR family regulator
MLGIDWTLLRSFLAVIECGSLSAAAVSISTTQPTLSRHIRELEAVVGVSLFTRSVRGLEPTDAALGLAEDARAMGVAAEALTRKAQGRSQRLIGTVRVSTSVILANLVLPSILADFRQAEPDIQIELVASDVAQNLLRRDADIAVRMFQPTQSALIARKLGDAPIGLFGTQSYLARRGRPKAIQDLRTHDLIGFDRSDLIVRAFAENGLAVTRDDFQIRCDDQMAYWNLIVAGAGIGIAQNILARRHSDLEPVEVGLRLRAMPVWLVMHEDVRTSARIRRVADFLTERLVAVFGNSS